MSEIINPKISIVSPVYLAENIIPTLVDRIIESVSSITDNFEIILVEDGSPDKSWEVIEEVSRKDKRIKAVKLSRNFGQHYAITAGFDLCRGEWIVLMDCDLQDDPKEIIKLYEKIIEGFDIVLAKRGKRKDTAFKKLANQLFYKIFNYLTGMNYDSEVGGYRIFSRKVLQNLSKIREYHRFINGLMQWMGYSVAYVEVSHNKRYSGESSYNLKKLCEFAIQIITSYSDKPLRLSIRLGASIAFLSIVFGCYILFKAIFYGSPVIGWSSLIVSIYFLGGMNMIVLGIMGIYIGKIFTEVKSRPLYLIDKTIGIE